MHSERDDVLRRAGRRGSAVLVAGIGVGAISLLAGPVQAAPPGAERLDIEETFHFDDPFLAADCGIASVEGSGDFSVSGWIYEDGSALVKERVRVQFTNPATGDVVFLDGVRNFRDSPEMVSSEDGFTTITIDSVTTGSPERWSAPGVGTIAMDRGRAVIRVTIVIDEATGEEVSFSNELIDSRGSHEIAANGFFLSDTAFGEVCSALGGEYLGGS